MKRFLAALLSLLCLWSLTACAAGTVDKTQPVFATENISKISFILQPNGEVETPDEDMAAISQWLASFRLGDKAEKALPPGSNSIRVKIEYRDGTVLENGLSTYEVGEQNYYLTHADAPACYLELLDAAADTPLSPQF